MIKFSFLIGFVLIIFSIAGVPEIWYRFIMGLSGILLVLFSTYIKFYSQSNSNTNATKDNDLDLEEASALDLVSHINKDE